MPYRGDPPRATDAPASLTLPARFLGGAALLLLHVGAVLWSAERVRQLSAAFGPTLLTFALARRHVRILALGAAVAAGGVVALQLVDVLARPWMVLPASDHHAESLALQIRWLLGFAPLAAVTAAAFLRHDRDEPNNTAPAPYVVQPIVVASVALFACVAGAFSTFYEMLMMVKGPVETVRVEPLVHEMAYAHGAVALAAAFVTFAAHRAGGRRTTAASAIATVAIVTVSTVMFMRGRWQLPKEGWYAWSNLQLVWSVLVALALFLGGKVANDVREAGLRAAANERDDLAGTLDATIGKTLRHCRYAAVVAGIGLTSTAAAEVTENASNVGLYAHAGGLLGMVAVALAFAGVLEQARRQEHIDEAIRRAE